MDIHNMHFQFIACFIIFRQIMPEIILDGQEQQCKAFKDLYHGDINALVKNWTQKDGIHR